MGLITWFLERIGWRKPRPVSGPPRSNLAASSDTAASTSTSNGQASPNSIEKQVRVRLTKTRRTFQRRAIRAKSLPYIETQGAPPYRYARYGSQTGHYLDLSRDGDEKKLKRFGLPVFHTPEQLADWIGLPLNKIAWLVHRFTGGKPASVQEAHYHFHWIKKRRGGWRLIESPKAMLKLVQTKILHELLDRVPVHSQAHGFTQGRSILTNARPHVGQATILKFDLTNFYTTISFARVVAIFRSLGYSREAAIWLGSLTTSSAPGNLGFQDQGPYVIVNYLRRHLPQGAPTSPALANLSAYWMDVRLAGLAKSFDAQYTRYADDLTFSGPEGLDYAMHYVIPLIQQIVRQERFAVNKSKSRILRAHQRQTVTGVVVNEKLNVARTEFDRMKAILTNCLRHGPASQNREHVDDFYSHLKGRIAYISMLNPSRGLQLQALFARINWTN